MIFADLIVHARKNGIKIFPSAMEPYTYILFKNNKKAKFSVSNRTHVEFVEMVTDSQKKILNTFDDITNTFNPNGVQKFIREVIIGKHNSTITFSSNINITFPGNPGESICKLLSDKGFNYNIHGKYWFTYSIDSKLKEWTLKHFA